MAIRIRVHYDGRAVVLDEPADLPVDQPMEAEFTVIEPTNGSDAEREAAWQRLLAGRISGVRIPDDALRRENLYEDRL